MGKTKINWANEVSFIIMGTLLAWSLFLAILSSTELVFDPTASLQRVFFAVLVLRIIFFNKKTFIVAACVLGVAGIVLAIDAAMVGAAQDPFNLRVSMFDNMREAAIGAVRYAAGFETYTLQYDGIISWTIVIALSLFVLVTGFLFFNFFALLSLSVVIFAISLNSGMFEYYTAFYVFIFCIVAFLVKHLNMKSLGGATRTSPFALYSMPFAAWCIVVALIVPTPAEGTAENFRHNFINRPFTAINEALHNLLHPRYFSLSQTGFGGGGTRQLGGDVSLNNGLAMRISPTSRNNTHYLTGAIFDVYSGTTWENSFRNDTFPLDFGENVQNLELLERMTSALTMWTVADFFEVYDDILVSFEEDIAHEMATFEEALIQILENEDASVAELTFAEFHMARMSYLYEELRQSRDNFIRWFIQVAFDDTWGEIFRFPITVDGQVVHDGATLDFVMGRHGSLTSFIRPTPTNFAEAVTTTLRTESIIFEHDFRSQSLFFSGIAVGVVPLEERAVYRDASDTLTTDALMQRGESYAVEFVETADNMNVHNILAASYRGVLQDALDALMSSDFDGSKLHFSAPQTDEIEFAHLLYEYLIPRADWIFENYTQLPTGLPQSVESLARYITRYAENDFERAVMVVEFLRNGFDYTLTPGQTPAGRDFVEWFLFDAQIGYCVHFATAFVVMMRTLGVPSRYVEGFMASGNVGRDGFMDVINRQGHAWGEVYFEGFGWYLFEPTPPGAVFSWANATATPTDPNWGGRDWTDFNWDSVMDLEGGWEEWGTDFYVNGELSDYIPEGEVVEGEQEEEQEQQMVAVGNLNFRRLITLIVYIVVGVGLLYLLLRILAGILRTKGLGKKDNNTAVQAYFGKMLRYLTFLNYAPIDGETPLEFARTIGRRLSFENESVSMEDVAYIYYKAQYSHNPITKGEREVMANAVAALEERLRNYVGKRRFFIYKYIRAVV